MRKFFSSKENRLKNLAKGRLQSKRNRLLKRIKVLESISKTALNENVEIELLKLKAKVGGAK